MLARGSSNHVGITPSSMANSKLVSHWMASWSCGMASKMVVSSWRMRASYSGSMRCWSSAATNAAIGASGVGRDTWKRQCGGDQAVALASGEHGERRHGGLGVAEVVEADRLDRFAVAHPQAGQGAVGVGTRRADLELGTRAEHRVLPHDPVGPWSGLPVGELARADRRAPTPSAGTPPRRCAAARCRPAARPPTPPRRLAGSRTYSSSRRCDCRPGPMRGPSAAFATGEHRPRAGSQVG